MVDAKVLSEFADIKGECPYRYQFEEDRFALATLGRVPCVGGDCLFSWH